MFSTHLKTLSLALLIFLSSLIATTLALGPGHEDHVHVKELNSTNFWQETKKGKWFLKFHTHSSGKCKKLKPEFDAFAEQLELRNIPMTIGEVNCYENADICAHYDVHVYPTIFYTRGEGEVHTRIDFLPTAENFLQFAQKATAQPVTELQENEILEFYSLVKKKLDTPNELDSYRMPFPMFVLVGGTQEEKDIFAKIASIYQDTNGFGTVSFLSPALKQALGIEQVHDSKINILVIKDQPVPEIFSDNLDFDFLVKWVWSRRFPIFTQLIPANFHTITHNGRYTLVAAIDAPHDQNAPKYLSYMRTAAIYNQARNFTFVWSDSHQYQAWFANYGVRTFPNFIALDIHEGCHYHSDLKAGEIVTPTRLEVFLKQVENDELPRNHQHVFVSGFVKDHPGLVAAFVAISVIGTWAVCVYSAPVGEAAAPSSSSPVLRKRKKIKDD